MNKITSIVVLLVVSFIVMASSNPEGSGLTSEGYSNREQAIQINTNLMVKNCYLHPQFKICRFIAKILLNHKLQI